MIVLYDQSAAFRGLVLGTNKTEILLGYTTLFGDAACAQSRVTYKTQVRQCRAMVPAPFSPPPSADLWPGQTDESELGVTYAEVDRLPCSSMSDKRPKPASGRLRRRWCARSSSGCRNQYKRLPPIIAKLSQRTVGYDFLPARRRS
jgi:NAD+ synthase